MRKDKKITTMLLLVVVILGLTVGYAILSTNLNINGSSTINNARWSIYFENVEEVDGSVTPTTEATINDTGNTVTYAVTLAKPGDFYEFTVDVRNGGTIDGMIESVTSKLNNQPITNLPAYLEYYVTYSDGVEIVNNHLLTAGTSEKYRVHIGFKRDINASDLPGTATTYNLSFGINETQATSAAAARPYFVYSKSYVSIGMNIVENAANLTLYGSYDTFINAGNKIFGRYLVNNNVITEAYLGFVQNNKVYFIKAYDADSNASNISVLQNAFGTSNCEYGPTNEPTMMNYSCTIGNFGVFTLPYGTVTAGDNNTDEVCEFIGENGSGYSYCSD